MKRDKEIDRDRDKERDIRGDMEREGDNSNLGCEQTYYRDGEQTELDSTSSAAVSKWSPFATDRDKDRDLSLCQNKTRDRDTDYNRYHDHDRGRDRDMTRGDDD